MKKRFAWAAAAVLVAAQSMTVLAGGINAYESSVISVACGTFTYNGKTYVAKAAYQAQLQAKLAEDGIDLTQEQANEAISLIYANVETGVVQGYLEEVGGASEETEESENTDDREKETDKKLKTEDGSPEKDSQREESASPESNQSQVQNSSPAAAAEQPTEAAGDTWSIG